MQPADRPVSPLAGAVRLSQVFGLRLFFRRDSREKLIVGATILAAAGFVVQAVIQFGLLGSSSLQYDYLPYFNAASTLNHGGNPYSVFLQTCATEWCNVGYIYPPLLAEAFRPLALLPLHAGAYIWLALTYLFFAASVTAVDRTVGSSLSRGARSALLLAALLFVPLYASFYFLQVNTLVLLILALAAWAYTRGQDGVAGAWLGVATVLRVTPLIQAPMLLRRWRDLRRPFGPLAFGLVGLGLLAVLTLLTRSTIDYLGTVLPRLGGSTAMLDNQSLPGVLLRLQALTGLASVTWVKVLTLVLQLGLVALTWWRSLRLEGRKQRAAVFAAFLAVTPIISSITWNHHLVTELLVLALLAPSLRVGSRAWWLTLVSYPLLWMSRDVTDPVVTGLGLAFPSGFAILPFVVLTSVNLLGMLLLWLACLNLLRTYRAAVEPAATL
ncbi:MAG TPA: glycosyltransferase family 87 protein [Candidatus Solibacter sp.]|jgi:hypothetical protein|nr:glycosyltransferase family 87 protein [Candidatus Solibacter sp.]